MASATTRNKVRSVTLDTAEYGADGDGKDEEKDPLHAAAEEGDIDTVKSFREWILTLAMQVARLR